MAGEFTAVLERALKRDDSAFAELWRTHQPPLVRYLRTFVGADAEDVASETWIQAARGLDRFEGDERAFRAWLFTIARRRMIDKLRADNRRPAVTASPIPEQAVPDASAAAELRLGTDAALRLIALLPRDQAEVVLLRSVAGLDVAHVARITGKRPGTVRVLAHRGLRRLRDLVESTCNETLPAHD